MSARAFLAAGAALLVAAACGQAGDGARTLPDVGFVDRTPGSGIAFVNHTGEYGKKRFVVEAKGGGVLALDYDGDADVDLYFVDGNSFRLDASGRVVSRTEHVAASGLQTIQLPLHSLPSGVYYYTIRASGVVHRGQFILVR